MPVDAAEIARVSTEPGELPDTMAAWVIREERFGKPIDAFRKLGSTVCLDTSDTGRACLECLVLLRPEWVRLDPDLTRNVLDNRGRRGALARFLQVCHAMDVSTIASGADAPSRAQLEEMGVTAIVTDQ